MNVEHRTLNVQHRIMNSINLKKTEQSKLTLRNPAVRCSALVCFKIDKAQRHQYSTFNVGRSMLDVQCSMFNQFNVPIKPSFTRGFLHRHIETFGITGKLHVTLPFDRICAFCPPDRHTSFPVGYTGALGSLHFLICQVGKNG